MAVNDVMGVSELAAELGCSGRWLRILVVQSGLGWKEKRGLVGIRWVVKRGEMLEWLRRRVDAKIGGHK